MAGNLRRVRDQRTLLVTFVVGALTGVLLSTLAVRGWPVRPEDDER
jgi:hypothetical protein